MLECHLAGYYPPLQPCARPEAPFTAFWPMFPGSSRGPAWRRRRGPQGIRPLELRSRHVAKWWAEAWTPA